MTSGEEKWFGRLVVLALIAFVVWQALFALYSNTTAILNQVLGTALVSSAAVCCFAHYELFDAEHPSRAWLRIRLWSLIATGALLLPCLGLYLA